MPNVRPAVSRNSENQLASGVLSCDLFVCQFFFCETGKLTEGSTPCQLTTALGTFDPLPPDGKISSRCFTVDRIEDLKGCFSSPASQLAHSHDSFGCHLAASRFQ